MSFTTAPLRLRAIEYGAPAPLAAQIAQAARTDAAGSRKLLAAAGARAAEMLHRSDVLIEFTSQGERAVNFAGLLRVAPHIELEIAPKFLGLDDVAPAWREDFFFLATLSKHGSLLINERLSASAGGSHRDLATLVGQALATMYRDVQRRPLRTYKIARETDFSLEGEVDASDLLLPATDGFEQQVLRYDRRNVYNASVRAAAQNLVTETTDPSVRSQLHRVIDDLSPQRRPTLRTPLLVPSRARVWQPLYTLSLDVLKGFGLRYQPGQASAPGYVVDTWRVWQDLLEVAARLGLGPRAVHPQKGFELGARRRLGAEKSTRLNVVPDVFVHGTSGPRFIIDAKYKANAAKSKVTISEADIYESLAFAQATGCSMVVLAYPKLTVRFKPGEGSLGSVQPFETVNVGTVTIVGVEVDCRGISQRGGLAEFAARYASTILALNDYVVTGSWPRVIPTEAQSRKAPIL